MHRILEDGKEESGSTMIKVECPDSFFKLTVINPKDDKTQLIFKTTKTESLMR